MRSNSLGYAQFMLENILKGNIAWKKKMFAQKQNLDTKKERFKRSPFKIFCSKYLNLNIMADNRRSGPLL